MYSASPSALSFSAIAFASESVICTVLSASLRICFASASPSAEKDAAMFPRSEIMRSYTAALFSSGRSSRFVSMASTVMP